MLSVVVLFIILNFLIWFLTSKKVIFSKECIFINGYRYDWYNVKFEYNDNSLILTLRRNTLGITYYDTKKNSYKKIYMKCKMLDYNFVMSIRN